MLKYILYLIIPFIIGACTASSTSGSKPKRVIGYDVIRKDGVNRVSVRRVNDVGADIELEFRRNSTRIANDIDNLSIRNPTGDQELNFSGFKGIRNSEFPTEIAIQYNYYNPLYSSTRNCFVIVRIDEPGDWQIVINH